MRIRTAASPSPVAGPPHPAATEAMRAPSLPLHPLHSLFSLISVRPTTWSHSLSCSRGPIGRHARGPHTRDGPRIQSAGGMLRALPWTRIGQLTPRMLFSNQRERMGRIACGFLIFLSISAILNLLTCWLLSRLILRLCCFWIARASN